MFMAAEAAQQIYSSLLALERWCTGTSRPTLRVTITEVKRVMKDWPSCTDDSAEPEATAATDPQHTVDTGAQLLSGPHGPNPTAIGDSGYIR